MFVFRAGAENNGLLALVEDPNLKKDFCVEEFRAGAQTERKDREKNDLLALIEDPKLNKDFGAEIDTLAIKSTGRILKF